MPLTLKLKDPSMNRDGEIDFIQKRLLLIETTSDQVYLIDYI